MKNRAYIRIKPLKEAEVCIPQKYLDQMAGKVYPADVFGQLTNPHDKQVYVTIAPGYRWAFYEDEVEVVEDEKKV